MKLLLDTHILVWSLMDDPRLKGHYRRALEGAEEIHVSAVSIWEIGIKQALGKLQIDGDIMTMIRRTNCLPLVVTWDHGIAAGLLPRHHDDPFDRLLIAQARCEGLTLVSADRMVRRYDVPLI